MFVPIARQNWGITVYLQRQRNNRRKYKIVEFKNYRIMGKIKVKGTMQRVAMFDENRVIGHAVRYSTVKEDELVSYTAQSSHIPESTLLASTIAICEAISFFVLNGHHVDLGKFGIFGIRSKQKAVTDAEQVDTSLVKHLTVGFKPSTDIKEAIANLRFEVEV